MRVLGIIPARHGSKGVPRKNLRVVAGQPLLAYTIQAAKESRLLTACLTTTDGDEIAELAQRWGSPVVRRPAELAADDTPIVPVLLHALEHAEREAAVPYDAVVLLQPSSPLRRGEDIDAAIRLLAGDPAVESVISVCPVADTHPARMYRLDADGWMEPLWPEWETAQRQDLPPLSYRNGAIYAVRREVLVERRTVMGSRKKAYVMPREWLVNIDDERDLMLAEELVRLWKERAVPHAHP